MLAGIVIGMFIGLAIALAVAVFIKGSPSPFVEHPQAQPSGKEKLPTGSAAPIAAASGEKARAPEKPRFDFYTILPGTEEPVTEKDIKQLDSASSAKNQYYLQAGAFQNEAEADNLKAKLALMGVEANIQTANVPDKGWPDLQVDDLNRVRNNLSQNGVTASLVKVHDQPPPR
jgi:cell division protein FtsN